MTLEESSTSFPLFFLHNVATITSSHSSATLSMAFAGARFAGSVLRGLSGDYNVECAYVESDVTSTPYFATPILLGVCCSLRTSPPLPFPSLPLATNASLYGV